MAEKLGCLSYVPFPPLVAGLTLLIFFAQTRTGKWIEEDLGLQFIFDAKGIVLCQFVVSASFAIRSIKTAFDEVDRRLENVALTLGYTQWGSFFHVSLPLARPGVVAGAILTWARAFGIFGPLMIFVGSFRGKTEVLSTTIYLEQSVGNLEVALAAALLLIAEMLRTLQKRAEKSGIANRIRTHVCDHDSITIEDPVDFVLAFWSAHEVPDIRRLLNEMNDCLVAGGKILLVEPIGHVTQEDFKQMTTATQEIGWQLEDSPRIRLSRAAVFVKTD